jgi:hypothetical protein
MRTRFPFYWDLREYLGDIDTSNVEVEQEDPIREEVDSLQIRSEHVKKTPVKRRKRQSQIVNNDISKETNTTIVIKRPTKDTTTNNKATTPPLVTKPHDENGIKKDHNQEFIVLKRRKIEIQQHATLINYQSKAIELMSLHCNTPEDKEELRHMVKTFSKNAFPSLSFSTNNTQKNNEEDELFYSDCN